MLVLCRLPCLVLVGRRTVRAALLRSSDDLDLALDSLSMSDGPVGVAPSRVVRESTSLSMRTRCIASDIDRRIRREKAAPQWLVAKLLEEIWAEATDEFVKETVADVRTQRRTDDRGRDDQTRSHVSFSPCSLTLPVVSHVLPSGRARRARRRASCRMTRCARAPS